MRSDPCRPPRGKIWEIGAKLQVVQTLRPACSRHMKDECRAKWAPQTGTANGTQARPTDCSMCRANNEEGEEE